ncbi:yellow laccase [Mycena sp. CBHHK59/15]|nr:yellow laccase [Mycena sp. CBHHK59/15]
MSLLWIIALSVLPTILAAIGPSATLTISNSAVSPDGFIRSAVLANNALPAPLIAANTGANMLLNVVNKLNDTTMLTPTTIVFVSVFQKGSSWADGPAFVSQCPIVPNNSFLYNFNVPGLLGTFWYHSHLSTQYCDGLRGPLVDDPNKKLYDVDNDSTVITLIDWYHTPAPEAGLVPTFSSTLVNGLGEHLSAPFIPIPLSPLAVITVTKGLRYRLVIIFPYPNWSFSIDGHLLTIIEVDGVNHLPETVDSIQIFAGQRYSFVLTANQAVSNYWIRAQPNLGAQGFVNGTNSAILRYATAPIADPVTVSNASNLLLETNLHPLVPSPVPGLPKPGGADINLNLQIVFNLTTLEFTVNNATFVPPTVPVLLQILSGAQTAAVYPLPLNSVIEVSIPGGSIGAPHPFHLHGHNFHVVRSAGNATYNYVNPVIRDVVSTGQFMTDNAGPWMLHCHIDWHLNLGLAIVFAEDIPDIDKSVQPPAWHALCPAYDAL